MEDFTARIKKHYINPGWLVQTVGIVVFSLDITFNLLQVAHELFDSFVAALITPFLTAYSYGTDLVKEPCRQTTMFIVTSVFNGTCDFVMTLFYVVTSTLLTLLSVAVRALVFILSALGVDPLFSQEHANRVLARKHAQQ